MCFCSFILFEQIEKILYCPLSSLQVFLHDGIATQCMAARRALVERRQHGTRNGKVTRQVKTAISGSILNSRFINMNYNNLVMQLRKLCNHPYLILEDVQTIPDPLYFRDLLCTSGKLVILDKLLDELLINQSHEGHKVLIFSQMTTMLNILQGFLHTKGVACYRLDGSTDRQTREDIISKFFNSKSSKYNHKNSSGEAFESDEDSDGSSEKVVSKNKVARVGDECSGSGSGIGEAVVDKEALVFLLSTRAGEYHAVLYNHII